MKKVTEAKEAKEFEQKIEYGIKETSELMEGLAELIIFMLPKLKDGVSNAVSALYKEMKSNALFEAKMLNALDKIKDVPKEAKNIGMLEGTRLTMKLLGYIPSIMVALKK